jgi:hypothetical protein
MEAGFLKWDCPAANAYMAPLHAVDFAIGGITTAQVLWQVQAGQVVRPIA